MGSVASLSTPRDLLSAIPKVVGADRCHRFRRTGPRPLEGRGHFKRVLAQSGKPGLQRDMLESMARQSEVSQLALAVTVKRAGRAVTSAAVPGERTAEFAFLQLRRGSARWATEEIRTHFLDYLKNYAARGKCTLLTAEVLESLAAK